MNNRVDIIVIGGGIMGNSVAWQLAKRRKSVLVLEKGDVACGAAGATDGVVGYHTKKPGPQLDLAVQSISMFDTLSDELGYDIEYKKNAGGMQPVEDKEQYDMLCDMVAQQRKSDVDIKMITAEEACEIEPMLAKDIAGALYSPTGAKVNPISLTMGFFRAAKKLGVEVLTGTSVNGFIIERERIVGVRTNRGEFFAESFVITAGAWSAEITEFAGITVPIKPRKGQLAVTEPLAHFMTATVQCARYNIIKFRPESIKDSTVLRLGASLSIEQLKDGALIIGGTREFMDYDGDNTFEAVSVMVERAVRFFPHLKDVSIVRFFAGFRPFTPDGLPLLGQLNGYDNLFIAAGHEGDGIALAPITGRLLGEIICDGASSYDISDFDPNRFVNTL